MNMMTLANAAEKAMVGTELPSTNAVWAIVLIGLAVVFAALVILIAFVWVMGKFFSSKKNKKKISASPTATSNRQSVKTAPSKKASTANITVNNDDEVIAVISAAIAAMGQADGKIYKLKSVRAVSKNVQRPAWAMAGLQSNTTPF